MSPHHTTGERARLGGGVMSLHHTTGERAIWGHVSTPHYR